jgi:hypothetical protein
MPYKVERHGQGYFVVNQNTGKKYSKKPLSKQIANKQLKAIEMNSSEGAGLADYLKSAYQKTKNITQNVSGRITGAIMGRNDYPPAERSIIDRYGNQKIVKICIYREKLDKSINTLVNVISLGQFNKVKNEYGYDHFYHLMMVVTLENNVPILIEKNEVINLHEYPKINPDAQKMELFIPPNFDMTFKQFLNNGQAFMGNDYFTYDALNNNCQRFIKSLILANRLGKDNPSIISFIEQDTTGLKRDLSPLTQSLFRKTTDLAARLNVLAKGKGFGKSD